MNLLKKIRKLQTIFNFCSLKIKHDNFRGVHIYGFDSVEQWERKIGKLTSDYIKKNRKAIWVYIDKSNYDLLFKIIEKDFCIHHCNNENVILYKWISEREDKIPLYGTHQISIASVISDNKYNILMYKDRENEKIWKFPMRTIYQKELLSDSAEKLSIIKTGINSTFEGIIGYRELDYFEFELGSIFFLCTLKGKQFQNSWNSSLNGKFYDFKWFNLSEYEKFLNEITMEKVTSTDKLSYETVLKYMIKEINPMKIMKSYRTMTTIAGESKDVNIQIYDGVD